MNLSSALLHRVARSRSGQSLPRAFSQGRDSRGTVTRRFTREGRNIAQDVAALRRDDTPRA